jgi:uracil-DNA glycosylase
VLAGVQEAEEEVKVIVVGSNPSCSSVTDEPFHISTRSKSILDQWFSWGPVEYIPLNVIDQKTPNNRPLTVAEIRVALPNLKAKLEAAGPYKIVALGQSASKAVSMLGLAHFPAPHPSGLNRKLNDKEYVEKMVRELRAYIEEKRG